MRYTNEYLKIDLDNWWFRSRNDIISYLLLSNFKDKKIKIIDIGCAGGSLLFYLKKKGFENLYGMDNNKSIIGSKNFKNINIVLGDALKTEFKNDFFDVVISSDILEHIENDEKAIEETNRILKKGGIFIVFVPAFKFLWSYHDVINEHKRRYTKRDLVNIIEKHGFKILKASYWNFSFFIPALLIRWFKGFFRIRSNDYYKLPYLINKFIILILKFENFILRFINFPFGVSVFVVAKKD
ncbi:MAG: class I SAM-dependent methyltransferase [Elusimicrobiota bacterium]